MKILTIAVMIAVAASAADRKNVLVYNVLVYKEPGRFGGWPANHGIWSWGNEIVVGFSAAYFKHMIGSSAAGTITTVITNARQVQFGLRLHY